MNFLNSKPDSSDGTSIGIEDTELNKNVEPGGLSRHTGQRQVNFVIDINHLLGRIKKGLKEKRI